MVSLFDVHDIFGDRGFSEYVKPLKDALIWEVQATVAVATVLLDWFLEGTLLGDVSLFVAVVAKAIAASTSKEGTLYRTSMTWGQGHPILDRRAYWGVGNMHVSDLLQCLHLLHPSLHSVHLHVDCEQRARQQLFLALHIAKLLLDLFDFDQTIPQTRDFSCEAWLIKSQKCFIDHVSAAVVGVEHVHLRGSHRYSASCWGMRDQID